MLWSAASRVRSMGGQRGVDASWVDERCRTISMAFPLVQELRGGAQLPLEGSRALHPRSRPDSQHQFRDTGRRTTHLLLLLLPGNCAIQVRVDRASLHLAFRFLTGYQPGHRRRSKSRLPARFPSSPMCAHVLPAAPPPPPAPAPLTVPVPVPPVLVVTVAVKAIQYGNTAVW